jgi:hypothetical protein
MKNAFLSCLGFMVLCAAMSQAGAAIISSPPDWSPMVMIPLDVTWTDANLPALGGTVTINGVVSTAGSPQTPGTARNLKRIGWPIGGVPFAAGDAFAAPYDVLNGTSFGRSYGWFTSLDLPSGYVWKIVETSSSPGLKVYDPYSTTFAELFTSADGNALTYNGNSANIPGPDVVNGAPEVTDQMFHPVFAAPSQTGPVFAEFTIYVATTDGTILATVTPGYQHFNFNATPEPAMLMLLGVGGMLLAARRRRTRRPPAR